MVKEDKAKGKKKVLDRRKKEKAASFFKTFIADTKKKLKNKGKAQASTNVAPKKDKKTVKETKKDTPTVAKGSTVKVKSGNTLSQIAKDKGITLKALLAANPDIKNPNLIRVGQMIKIPTKGKGSVYEGMSKKKMASMAMNQGGASMKHKKTKYMQKGGATKKSKMMNKGGAMKKKTKMMNKGGAMKKKSKMMARGGAARRR